MLRSPVQLEELAKNVEADQMLAGELASEVADAINSFISLQPDLPAQVGAKTVTAADLESTHRVLELVNRVTPGWTIILRGKAFEPDGHWTCSLRPSDINDDAELIGYAKGPDISNTLVATLLRVLARLTQKHD
jgi:hypothetical protein